LRPRLNAIASECPLLWRQCLGFGRSRRGGSSGVSCKAANSFKIRVFAVAGDDVDEIQAEVVLLYIGTEPSIAAPPSPINATTGRPVRFLLLCESYADRSWSVPTQSTTRVTVVGFRFFQSATNCMRSPQLEGDSCTMMAFFRLDCIQRCEKLARPSADYLPTKKQASSPAEAAATIGPHFSGISSASDSRASLASANRLSPTAAAAASFGSEVICSNSVPFGR